MQRSVWQDRGITSCCPSACRKEECPRGSPPSCPPHRMPVLQKTQCCDEYKCVCNCTSSAVTCPLGYLASTVTNDCGCTTTTCLPDKVGAARLQLGQWPDTCSLWKTCLPAHTSAAWPSEGASAFHLSLNLIGSGGTYRDATRFRAWLGAIDDSKHVNDSKT